MSDNGPIAADSCCVSSTEPAAPDRLPPPDAPQADADLAAFAKAVGHPVRVRILRMLAHREVPRCSEIVGELPLAQSTVSEHLRILKNAGLVQSNENGPGVSYCIVPAALNRFKALLEAV